MALFKVYLAVNTLSENFYRLPIRAGWDSILDFWFTFSQFYCTFSELEKYIVIWNAVQDFWDLITKKRAVFWSIEA